MVVDFEEDRAVVLRALLEKRTRIWWLTGRQPRQERHIASFVMRSSDPCAKNGRYERLGARAP